MTDDLEGRLDPSKLEDPEPTPNVESEKDFYDQNSYESSGFQLVYPSPTPTLSPPLPDPIKINVTFFFTEVDTLILDGDLQTLSFGHEGWLCSFSTKAGLVPPIVLRAAKDGVLSARVTLPEGAVELYKNIDCTATFSYGSASFTVTSDEARYVSA